MGVATVPDERLLVERHRDEGHAGSFEILYRRYFPRLIRHCASRLGDRHAAEEVAQETLVRALVHLHRFDVSRPMWPWLRAIAANLVIDRTRTREVPVDRVELPGTEEAPACEERMLLAQALSRLPRRQRIAIGLRYLDDWDPADAAAFLGLNRSAFDQLLFRARRRLRQEYRRVSRGLAGVLLLPSRWLRRTASRAEAQVQATAASAAAAVGPVTALHLASGILALIVAGGTVKVPAHEGLDVRPSVQAAVTSSRPAHPAQNHPESAAAPAPAPPATGSPAGGHKPSPPQASGGSHGGGAPPTHVDHVAGILGDVADPNGGVTQPEDARITTVSASPRFEDDGTAYAVGTTDCAPEGCSPVLFRTTDGGATWERLPASGLRGEQLLLPPGNDPRIFAMGPAGLQVSEDGGRSFGPAAVTGAPYTTGSAAISPRFNSGDPRILIGAQTLMRYRDDLGVLEPEPAAVTGPLEPAFSPFGDAVLLGGLGWDAGTGTFAGLVHRCGGSVCSSATLPGTGTAPKIRFAADARGPLYAFTHQGMFASADGGQSFTSVATPWQGSLLWDLAVAPGGGTLFAAVLPESAGGEAGLYVSGDAGSSWTRLADPLLAGGAWTVTLAGGRVFLALGDSGLACSADGGVTWASRCE